jgi:hypothetical protein
MKNKLYGIILAVAVLAIALVILFYWETRPSTPNSLGTAQADYKNISYKINGEDVLLINGSAKTLDKIGVGSESGTTTAYFGNEVRGDFNGDGREDVAFILTQDTGGSGTFYYLAAALGAANGDVGTDAVFLGDRIAPVSTEFKDGAIVVKYLDRKPNEPMTATPTVPVTENFKFLNGQLEIIK